MTRLESTKGQGQPRLNPGEILVTELAKGKSGILVINRPVAAPFGLTPLSESLIQQSREARLMAKPGWTDEIQPEAPTIVYQNEATQPDSSVALWDRALNLLPKDAKTTIGALSVAAIVAACGNGNPSPSASSRTSEASVGPSGSLDASKAIVIPSGSPEATPKPDLYHVIHQDAVDKGTIVYLPANTVFVGDPAAIWTQANLPDGTKLEAYGTKSYDTQIKDQYLASHGGEIVGDSDAFTGFVGVTKQGIYVQTLADSGLSYQTVQNETEAENLAGIKKIETEFLGCGHDAEGHPTGCKSGADVVHLPGQNQVMVHNGIAANPSENPTASAAPLITPELSLPNGVDLTNMTPQQEQSMILSWFASGKVDPNSVEGQKLTDYLNCLCKNGACEAPMTPAPTPTPTPTTPSPEVCKTTDIEHAYGGWSKKDIAKKAPVEKYDGEAIFQSDGTVIENGKKITKYGYALKEAVIFVVKDEVDGKPATYRYDFGGDLQPFCANLSEADRAKALENDITGSFTRTENPVNKVVVITVNNDGSHSEKVITKAEWMKLHPKN